MVLLEWRSDGVDGGFAAMIQAAEFWTRQCSRWAVVRLWARAPKLRSTVNQSSRVWVRQPGEEEVRQVVSDPPPRSKKMRMVRMRTPGSAALRSSLVGVDSAGSVLWSGWGPDWNGLGRTDLGR